MSASSAAATELLQHDSVDALVVAAPSSAKPGSRAKLVVWLSRQGAPVAGVPLFVQIVTTAAASSGSGRSVTVTVMATTGSDGSAVVFVPPRARGAAGARSIISAFTADARAQGVKGGVPLASPRVRMAWR